MLRGDVRGHVWHYSPVAVANEDAVQERLASQALPTAQLLPLSPAEFYE